jgi:phosphatidylserine synthase
MMALLALLGVLMVSTLRYSSFKNAGSGRQSIYVLLLIAALGMAVWLYSRYALLILSGVYVGHGLIWYFIGAVRPRRHEPQVESVEG